MQPTKSAVATPINIKWWTRFVHAQAMNEHTLHTTHRMNVATVAAEGFFGLRFNWIYLGGTMCRGHSYIHGGWHGICSYHRHHPTFTICYLSFTYLLTSWWYYINHYNKIVSCLKSLVQSDDPTQTWMRFLCASPVIFWAAAATVMPILVKSNKSHQKENGAVLCKTAQQPRSMVKAYSLIKGLLLAHRPRALVKASSLIQQVLLQAEWPRALAKAASSRTQGLLQAQRFVAEPSNPLDLWRNLLYLCKTPMYDALAVHAFFLIWGVVETVQYVTLTTPPW